MRLTAYLNGGRVGWFEQVSTGAVALEYDPVWQEEGGRRELSWSLPKSRRRHVGAEPDNYLWNLLPDNVAVLERWGQRFGVSPRNPMALLAHVGLDAAGAIQVVDSQEHDDPELHGREASRTRPRSWSPASTEHGGRMARWSGCIRRTSHRPPACIRP